MAGSVKIKIQALSKYKRAFDAVGKQFTRIKKLALGASGAIKGMFKHMFSVRSMLAGGGIVAGLVATVKQSQNFALQMARVHTMLQKGDIAAFTKDVRELSAELGLTKDELSRGLYQVLSAGVPRENAIEFLTVASRAAVAGVTDVETAVDGLTTVTNAYGRANLSVQRASDIMFATVYKGKTTFPELSQFIGQLTGLAAKAGIEFEELGGAIASVAKQGIQTDKAVVGLRQAIVNLLRPSTELAALYKKMEITGGALLERHGIVGALNMIEEAAGGNIDAIVQFVQNMRAIPAVLALTGKSADITADAIGFVTNSVGEADKAFGKVDKIRGWSKLLQASHNVLLRLGDVVNVAVMPAITRMSQVIARLAESAGFERRLQGYTDRLRDFATAAENVVRIMRFGDQDQRDAMITSFKDVLSAFISDAFMTAAKAFMVVAPKIGSLIGKGFMAGIELIPGARRREAIKSLGIEGGPNHPRYSDEEKSILENMIQRRMKAIHKRRTDVGFDLAQGVDNQTFAEAWKRFQKGLAEQSFSLNAQGDPMSRHVRGDTSYYRTDNLGSLYQAGRTRGLAQYGLTGGATGASQFQSTDLAEIFNRAFGDVLTGAKKEPSGTYSDPVFMRMVDPEVSFTHGAGELIA